MVDLKDALVTIGRRLSLPWLTKTLWLSGALILLAAAAGCGTGSTTVTVVQRSAPLRSCGSFPEASKPARCLTQAQRRQLAENRQLALKKKAAKIAAAQRAKARAAKVAARAAVVKAGAAYAKANAWHQGYLGPSGDNLDIYGRWRRNVPCADYATYGCLHFEAITKNGCRYLDISVNEIRGGAIVGDILANQLNVPPKTPVILELDADTSGITGGPPTFTCTNY